MFGWVIDSEGRLFHKFIVAEKKLPLYAGVSATVRSNVSRRMVRGTQREYSSKPLKHSIVKRLPKILGDLFRVKIR